LRHGCGLGGPFVQRLDGPEVMGALAQEETRQARSLVDFFLEVGGMRLKIAAAGPDCESDIKSATGLAHGRCRSGRRNVLAQCIRLRCHFGKPVFDHIAD
jgi:hypothetical protein